jgi:hypothetical protein
MEGGEGNPGVPGLSIGNSHQSTQLEDVTHLFSPGKRELTPADQQAVAIERHSFELYEAPAHTNRGSRPETQQCPPAPARQARGKPCTTDEVPSVRALYRPNHVAGGPAVPLQGAGL